MANLELLSDYLRKSEELKKEQLENVNKVIQNIVELFDSYGITKLGLWNEELEDYNENMKSLYSKEDKVLFDGLNPQFDYLLYYGRADEDNCLGRVVAIEIIEQEVYFFIGDTWNDTSYRIPAIDAFKFPEEEHVDFDEVIAALHDSIQFNIDNNIPVKKWELAHYGCVNPYTYEYALGCDSDEDDFDFEDE